MQNTFKVGDKVKVVKLKSVGTPLSYHEFTDKTFVINAVPSSKHGVSCKPPPGSTYANLFFYNDEIELVKDEPIIQEVVPTPKKNIAWAVVDKGTGKVQWIRQTRSVARKLAQFQNETSTHLYQVKKIEFNFV
jgi:hypothetical protein